jgi:hypothetical protein
MDLDRFNFVTAQKQVLEGAPAHACSGAGAITSTAASIMQCNLQPAGILSFRFRAEIPLLESMSA